MVLGAPTKTRLESSIQGDLTPIGCMVDFSGSNNHELIEVPEKFFLNQSQLISLQLNGVFVSAARLDNKQRLPDGLFTGLTGLTVLQIQHAWTINSGSRMVCSQGSLA